MTISRLLGATIASGAVAPLVAIAASSTSPDSCAKASSTPSQAACKPWQWSPAKHERDAAGE